VKQGEDFSQKFKEVNRLITDLTEFNVRVKEFQDRLKRIIEDYSNLIRDMIDFCVRVIDQDKNTLNQAIFLFTLYLEAASSLFS
jgi:hypothetical protein